MSLLDLVPPEYRIALGLVAILAVAGVSFGAGHHVGYNSGKLEAQTEFAKVEKDYRGKIDGLNTTVSTLKGNISTLEAAIQEQNLRVEALAIQTAAAQRAQAAAKRIADEQIAQSARRLKKLEATIAQAQTCGDVLVAYWGLSP